MKITGFRVEQYLMRMDRAVGDANLPEGVDLMPGSILYLDTDERNSGIALGYGGASVPLRFQVLEGADPRETVVPRNSMNDLMKQAET